MIWNKPGLWRGLSSLFCFLLALSVVAGLILEANAPAVDAFLGTESSHTVITEDEAENTVPILSPWRTAWYSAVGLSGILTAGCATLYLLALRRVRRHRRR